MPNKSIIVGLDVGTTKVCTLVGEVDPKTQKIDIIGIGSHASLGLKKGSVVNIEQTIKAIKCSVEEAKLMSGIEIERASIGVAGNHIRSFNSSGVVAIKSPEITQADVDNVLDAAKAIVIPSDREIIHVIPTDFHVDNTRGIKNPIGMCGTRLEVFVHIVTGSIPLIQNLAKCVEEAGIFVDGIVLQPIASSESVLTTEEKDIGVCIVDIGGGTTDLAIWKNNALIHTEVIPVGGNHFTNDLAMALKAPYKEAERIKIQHGSILSEIINQNSHISVQGIPGTKSREVSLKLVSEVLGARAEELFELVQNVIDKKNLKEEVYGGFVFTGGGSLINGVSQLAEYVLMKPCKVGYPISFGGMTNIMKNPKYSTVLGLLLHNSRVYRPFKRNTYKNNESVLGKIGTSIKDMIRDIF